jgi:multidrug efflux pump subunit AcrA (membrane-fusion protein)
VDPSTYVLPINVNERNLPRLRVGQKAYVTVDSAGDREFLARVRRINPGVDLQSSAVKVILEFDKKDHQYLREQAFARYRLIMDTHEDALTVPKDAIIEDNTRRYVMIAEPTAVPEEADEPETADAGADVPVEEGPQSAYVASRVEVEVGLEDAEYTEILSGVAPDALVITLGQQTVNDGDPVEISTIESALESTAELSADEALEAARAEDEAESGDRSRGGRRGPRM